RALDSLRASDEHRGTLMERPSMIVHVLFFAQARERVGHAQLELELPEGSRVADALAELERRHPGLAELKPHLAIAVNQRLAPAGTALQHGAELALLPPGGGG